MPLHTEKKRPAEIAKELPYSVRHEDLPTPDRVAALAQRELPIDINHLENYSTEEVAQLILSQNTDEESGRDLAFAIMWQMMLKENEQYRGGDLRPGGFSPTIESKILGLISIDTALATDFRGKPIRSKETQEKLRQIVKLSEIYELIIEIDAWFSHKKKREAEAEILEKGAESLQQLIELASASLLGYGETILDESVAAIAALQEIAQQRKSLEADLIAEIVDLHYNLMHFILIDPEGEAIYQYWLDTINSCLGWNFNQSMALTTAKYHARIFGSGGKNDKSEYVEIGKLINSTDPETHDPRKIDFPSDLKLKEIVQILDRIRSKYPHEDYPEEITIRARYEQLRIQFGIENSGFVIGQKIRDFFLGLKKRYKIKKNRID